MKAGFVFNQNKCAGCYACTAACILENGWSFSPRTIYTFNASASQLFPVINLSLACNHCKDAVCLSGCPSSSFTREPSTGAIILDNSKCIGCKYCQWNCPYDAPKYSGTERIMGKCNLCYSRVMESLDPACSTACPTGALSYGNLNEQPENNPLPWFPDKKLEPAVVISGTADSKPLRIIPSSRFSAEMDNTATTGRMVSGEWSLIAFSFLVTCAAAGIISSLIGGLYPGKISLVSVIILAAFLSFFHLGRKLRAWRAVSNIRTSPLSREIVLFLLFSAASLLTVTLMLPWLLIMASVTGLMLTMIIDSVYIFADRRRFVWLHSGQTFITLLLMISFLSGKIIPFLFIAALKLAFSAYSLLRFRQNIFHFGARYLRAGILLVTGVSLITGISYPGHPLLLLFFTGELIDRILFYYDFNPLNINELIQGQLIKPEYEKE